MSYWEGQTHLAPRDIAGRARDGIFTQFNVLERRAVIKNTEWRLPDAADGGVFQSFEEQPVWSARANFTPPNGHGGAYCDIFVYDDGIRRRVVLEIGNSLGLGSRAKKFANGIIDAIQDGGTG